MALGEIEILYQVTCVKCQNVEYPPASNKIYAKEWLKEHGWQIKYKKWVCAECHTKRPK